MPGGNVNTSEPETELGRRGVFAAADDPAHGSAINAQVTLGRKVTSIGNLIVEEGVVNAQRGKYVCVWSWT
jgi:hypothetical protein